MKKAVCLICLIVFFLDIAQSEPLKLSPEDISLVSQTIDFVFMDSFPKARETASKFNGQDPRCSIYHLLCASIVYAEMKDAENYDRKQKFFEHIDACIDILKQCTDENKDDAWAHFFLGSASGYKTAWHSEKGNWIKTFFWGVKTRNCFEKAVKIDPALYDAYAGLGSYHYWSSAKLAKYFPLLSDNRDLGIEELKLAKDSSFFSINTASAALAWAFINEKKNQEALKEAITLSLSISGGRQALWIIASAYWQMNDFSNAAKTYGLIIESLQKAGNQNNYNLILCHFRRGICFYNLKNYPKAQKEFEAIFSYKLSSEIRKKHENILAKAKKQIEKIKEKTNQTN